MNMSKENYARFKKFTDYVLETANDEQVEYLLGVLADACEFAANRCKEEAERAKKNNGKN